MNGTKVVDHLDELLCGTGVLSDGCCAAGGAILHLLDVQEGHAPPAPFGDIDLFVFCADPYHKQGICCCRKRRPSTRSRPQQMTHDPECPARPCPCGCDVEWARLLTLFEERFPQATFKSLKNADVVIIEGPGLPHPIQMILAPDGPEELIKRFDLDYIRCALLHTGKVLSTRENKLARRTRRVIQFVDSTSPRRLYKATLKDFAVPNQDKVEVVGKLEYETRVIKHSQSVSSAALAMQWFRARIIRSAAYDEMEFVHTKYVCPVGLKTIPQKGPSSNFCQMHLWVSVEGEAADDQSALMVRNVGHQALLRCRGRVCQVFKDQAADHVIMQLNGKLNVQLKKLLHTVYTHKDHQNEQNDPPFGVPFRPNHKIKISVFKGSNIQVPESNRVYDMDFKVIRWAGGPIGTIIIAAHKFTPVEDSAPDVCHVVLPDFLKVIGFSTKPKVSEVH